MVNDDGTAAVNVTMNPARTTAELALKGPANAGTEYKRRTRNAPLAITGGLGLFKNARGSMDLVARKSGTEYAFIFNVIP